MNRLFYERPANHGKPARLLRLMRQTDSRYVVLVVNSVLHAFYDCALAFGADLLCALERNEGELEIMRGLLQ